MEVLGTSPRVTRWLEAEVSANCPVGQLCFCAFRLIFPMGNSPNLVPWPSWKKGVSYLIPSNTSPSAYTSCDQLHRLTLILRKCLRTRTCHLFIDTVGPTPSPVNIQLMNFLGMGHVTASSIYIPTKSRDIPVIFIYLVSKSHSVHDG